MKTSKKKRPKCSSKHTKKTENKEVTSDHKKAYQLPVSAYVVSNLSYNDFNISFFLLYKDRIKQFVYKANIYYCLSAKSAFLLTPSLCGKH